MADDRRVYTDDEFAAILRTAAELANRGEQLSISSHGLTLADMKAAAAQAGLDPALIERAARQVTTHAPEIPFERIIGGPLMHAHGVHFAVPFDEQTAARLLSAVRINADFHSSDPGHASAFGMTWKASGAGDVLSVVARPEDDGTAVSVSIDRRGTFTVISMATAFVMFFPVMFSIFALGPENPALGVAGVVGGAGGVLAIARNFWASSSRRVHEKLVSAMETVRRALPRGDNDNPG